jgi:WD40 repeat protein
VAREEGWRVQLWDLGGQEARVRATLNLDGGGHSGGSLTLEEGNSFLGVAESGGNPARPEDRPEREKRNPLLALAEDGTTLVAARPGGPLRLFDLAGKAPAERLPVGDADFVVWASFLPDGERVVTLSRDSGVRLWDLGGDRPALLSVTPSPKPVLYRCYLTPDGRTLVLSQGERFGYYPLRVLRLGDGPPTEVAVLQGPKATRSTRIRGVGPLVAVQADDHKDIWDVSGREPRKRPDLAAVADKILRGDLAVSPAGRTMALYDWDWKLKIWDQTANPPRARFTVPDSSRPVEFSADGHLLAAISHRANGAVVTLWDIQGDQPREYGTLEYHDRLEKVRFSPDGRLVVTTHGDRVVLWEAASGRRLREWWAPGGAVPSFAPDGRHLLVVTGVGEAWVVRLCAGQDSPDRKLAARAQLLRARRDLRQKKVPEALAKLTEAVNLDPNCAEAYYSRALVYEQAGKPDQALDDLTKVIALDRRHARAYYRRGLLYADRGDLKSARADLDRAAAIDPDLVPKQLGPR